MLDIFFQGVRVEDDEDDDDHDSSEWLFDLQEPEGEVLVTPWSHLYLICKWMTHLDISHVYNRLVFPPPIGPYLRSMRP